jgi:MoaA/NifB/PqqE/SkfB family radical SAM enzyme
MIHLDDIKALNIEISSVCNANCAFCMRKEKVRTYGNHLITLADYRLLPLDFLKQLRRVSFGGGFGDLCCNPQLVEIAAFTRGMNKEVLLEGDTNGSNQQQSWWRSLGASFGKGAMVFALDGLEDTHHLHRRGTDFQKIIRNMEAFVAGGGTAFWKFILFEHNEHQVSRAEELARELGCSRFFVISSRDYDDRLRKPASLQQAIKRDIYRQYRQSLSDDESKAVCRPLLNRSIYIAADGTVHPCCFAHCMYITEHSSEFRFVLSLVEQYRTEINFKTTPLEDILRGRYFEEVMKKAPNNNYCITKCNKHRNRIRKELVLYDRTF